MSATDILGELSPVRARLAEAERLLTQRRGELNAALSLVGAQYRESDVRDARTLLERSEARVAELRERVAALEHGLPTAGALTHARANARELADLLPQMAQRYADAWHRLREKLEDAETAARELLDAQRRFASTRATLADLSTQYALGVSTPPLPALPRNEADLVLYQSLLIGEVSQGHEPRDTVLNYLHDARAKLAS